jgi:trimethylamine--corrinoid protein Co-methyltransferase
VIRDVGPGGHFLAHKHTVRHIREFTTQRFIEREYPGGQDDGAARNPEAWEQAGNEARRLLDSHHVEPLPPRVQARLEDVIESAAG